MIIVYKSLNVSLYITLLYVRILRETLQHHKGEIQNEKVGI